MFKLDLIKKIIAGFAIIIILTLFVIIFGWFSSKKIKYIENIQLKAYDIEINMLECRREEKNVIIRGLVPEHLTKWNRAFGKIIKLGDEVKTEGYITLQEYELFKRKILEYGRVFEELIQELKDKKVINPEKLHLYDNRFKSTGRVILVLGKKVINDSQQHENKLYVKISKLFLSVSSFVIIFSLILGYVTVKNIRSSVKKIENLSLELRNSNMELALGLSEHFEVLKRVADGSLDVKAPEDSSNELLSKLGQVINQTIGRLIESARKELEQYYNLTDSGIRIIDSEFNVVRSNKAMDVFSGTFFEGLPVNKSGIKCYEQFKGIFCHSSKCTLKRILAGEERIKIEIEKEGIRGRKLYCILNALPIKDKKGIVTGIIEEFIDVTALKTIQNEVQKISMTLALDLSEILEALQKVANGDLTVRVNEKSEDQLIAKLCEAINKTIKNLRESWDNLEIAKRYSESIIESISDILIVIDREFKIKTVNKTAIKLLGYKEEELIDKPLLVFIEAKKESLSGIELIEEDEFRNFEINFKQKNGGRIPTLFSIAVIKDEAGKTKYFVCAAKDITERKKAEEELSKYIHKIEDINRELDSYTYIISHDLKEPLRSINNFSTFILTEYRDKLDDTGKNYIERMKANTVRIQSIVEDFLEVSNIERKIDSFEQVKTEELINDAKMKMKNKINEKKPDIIINGGFPVIYCNRAGITDVFANLISNAIKFADKEKLKIEIGWRDREGYYEFYVKDNGPGIEEQYFEKIFKLFQRLVKREEYKGTGVGLTIAKKIVEVHKGKIWLESKNGEGTTFYFTIPKELS